MQHLALLLAISLTTAPAQPLDACECLPAPADEGDIVLAWNEVALQAIRTADSPPPMAARNLAMVHAAIYDAVNAVRQTHQPYRSGATAPPTTSAQVAGAVAAHRVLSELYPRQTARFDEALRRSTVNVAGGAAAAQGVALGQQVGEEMLTWRSRDGADRRVEAAPAQRWGEWLPTPPEFGGPVLPQWPRVTCFCLRAAAQFRPGPPPHLHSAAYVQSLHQVKAWGRTDSNLRTAEQTEFACFWAGGSGTVTPPGQWNRIAQTIAHQRRQSLADNARLFALLNLSLADAGIACWDCKYHYNLWRPVTAIQHADQIGQHALADPTWLPLLATPPFSAYCSGHSTFSAAAAAVLTHHCGADAVSFAAQSEDLPGVTRTFASFSVAAREAGLSRIFGEIHYDFDNNAGLQAGRSLGEYVCRHYLLPRDGVARRAETGFAVRRR